jgi:hypothetical protein
MITLFVVGIVISNTVLVTLYWVIMQLYYINLGNWVSSALFPTDPPCMRAAFMHLPDTGKESFLVLFSGAGYLSRRRPRSLRYSPRNSDGPGYSEIR